jgi:hypothetical protein
MSECIRFHDLPVAGIDPMTASTARAFPKHTHDQYGIGVIDSGGHASWSGRGQVEPVSASLADSKAGNDGFGPFALSPLVLSPSSLKALRRVSPAGGAKKNFARSRQPVTGLSVSRAERTLDKAQSLERGQCLLDVR